MRYTIRYKLPGSLLDSKNEFSEHLQNLKIHKILGAHVDIDFGQNSRVSVLATRGKPSTWSPRGGLVELPRLTAASKSSLVRTSPKFQNTPNYMSDAFIKLMLNPFVICDFGKPWTSNQV